MTSLLFVHGTSVRQSGYKFTLKTIQENVETYQLTKINRVEGCLWGDPFGAKLNFKGLSIPEYPVESEEDEVNLELWGHLFSDSLYEIRIITVTSISSGEKQYAKDPFQEKTPGEELDSYLENIVISSELEKKLQQGGISDVFIQACTNIRASKTYKDMLLFVKDPMGNFQDALARAIVAEAAILTENNPKLTLTTNRALLEDTVQLVRKCLGPDQAGVLQDIVHHFLTWRINKKRQIRIDQATLMVGDILLYQSRGEKIQELIHSKIKEIAIEPIILLAHSLGGVACVDLLVKTNLSSVVRKLITVGSQAPYFFEINALKSLEIDSNNRTTGYLPSYFPDWLNIYDNRDFLSFKGEEIFENRVKDICVNNRLPFPQSHSGYWFNKEVYFAINEFIN